MWVATSSLRKSEGQVFYQRLNLILAEAQFDKQIDRQFLKLRKKKHCQEPWFLS